MRQRIIHHFRKLFADQLILMLTGSRSEDLPILLVQTRKNLQQMFIRLPRTENDLRKSRSGFPRCVSSLAYPISSNGSFLKYFSASSIEISLFFTFSNTSLASKAFTSFSFFPFFHTQIRYNIKRKPKPLLYQNLLFSDTANLQLSLF